MSLTPYVLGCDIGGTSCRMGAVTKDGTVLHFSVKSSRDFLVSTQPVFALAKLMKQFMDEVEGQAISICIGFPGTVDKNKKVVLSCPNLPPFDGLNMEDHLQAALQMQIPVFVEHEVLFLLWNDLKKHQLVEKDCVMAVYLGTGLGNAMYIHGRLLEGKNGNSGELGHIPIAGDTTICPCGSEGCIEMHASGKRLEEIQKQYFPDEKNFDVLLQNHKDHPAIVAFLDYVAIAIATEINILDPDCILMGGGVLNIPSFPYEALLDRIRYRTRKPTPANNLHFIRADSDVQCGSRGAGLYYWDLVLKQ